VAGWFDRVRRAVVVQPPVHVPQTTVARPRVVVHLDAVQRQRQHDRTTRALDPHNLVVVQPQPRDVAQAVERARLDRRYPAPAQVEHREVGEHLERCGPDHGHRVAAQHQLHQLRIIVERLGRNVSDPVVGQVQFDQVGQALERGVVHVRDPAPGHEDLL